MDLISNSEDDGYIKSSDWQDDVCKAHISLPPGDKVQTRQSR